jgi:hypothetical protein
VSLASVAVLEPAEQATTSNPNKIVLPITAKPIMQSGEEQQAGQRDGGAYGTENGKLVRTHMDAAGIPALVEAIRHLHGLEATWLESVPVHEQHEGGTVWEGEVQVFAVEHPKATRVYAWSHETEGGKRRFHAVLGATPVDDPRVAVRTAILNTA